MIDIGSGYLCEYVKIYLIGESGYLRINEVTSAYLDKRGIYCVDTIDGSTYKFPMRNISYVYESKKEKN